MRTKAKTICILVCMALSCLSPAAAEQNTAIEMAVHQARETGVSEATLNRLLTAGYRYPVGSTDMARFINTIGKAAAQGLPYTPLVDKMEEGLSKKIPIERIHQVLTQQLVNLRTADQLLRQTFPGENAVTQAAVGRIADLMMTGLSVNEIQDVMTSAPAAKLNEHLEAAAFLTVLKQAGLPSDSARRIVKAGMQKHFFTTFPMDLAFTVKAAHDQKIPDDRIGNEVMQVVNGQQNALQMQHNLRLGPIHAPTSMPSDYQRPADSGQGRTNRGSSSSGGSGGGSSGGSGGGGGRGHGSGGRGGGHGGGGRH